MTVCFFLSLALQVLVLLFTKNMFMYLNTVVQSKILVTMKGMEKAKQLGPLPNR